MAEFVPVNRHILIEPPSSPIEPANSDFGILLPDDYEPALSTHVAVKILDWAEDVKLRLEDYQTAVVQRSMIEEVVYKQQTFHIILENYVFGLIE